MKLAIPLAALGLASCAPAMPSITPPTSAEVAARAAELAATGMRPADYFAVGSLLVGETCHGYFRTLGDRAARLDAAATEVGLATGAAAGIGAAAGLGVGGMAITAISGMLLQGTLGVARDLPVPYPVATAHLVNKALVEYLIAAPEPRTIAEAAVLVDGAAWLCSVPGSTWLAQQAVAAASVYAIPPVSRGMLAPPIVGVR